MLPSFAPTKTPVFRIFCTFFALSAFFLFVASSLRAEENRRIFIGTYTGGESGGEGIYTGLFDTEKGKLTGPELVANCENPSFLAIHPTKDRLYAVGSKGKIGMLFAFRFVRETGQLIPLNEKEIPGRSACHLALCRSEDGVSEAIVLASYGSSKIVSFPLRSDGRIGDFVSDIRHEGRGPNASRQKEPHPHGVYFDRFDGKTVSIPDLGIDRVLFYEIDLKTARLTPKTDRPALQLPPGGGPRHLAASERFVYVNNELTSTVCVFDLRGKEPNRPIQEISTLPEGVADPKFSTAEIELSADGRFLYVSNRGHESIAVYAVDSHAGKLSLVQIAPCGGVRPRFFRLDPTGRFLISANKNSGDMTVLKVDATTGMLALLPDKVSVPRPVCVVFVPESNRSDGVYRHPDRTNPVWKKGLSESGFLLERE